MQGLGPGFKLIMNLQNTSHNTPSRDLLITFLADQTLYTISKSLIEVRFLQTYFWETQGGCSSDVEIHNGAYLFSPICSQWTLSLPREKGGREKVHWEQMGSIGEIRSQATRTASMVIILVRFLLTLNRDFSTHTYMK